MDLDAILTEVGQFGKFQIITYCLISLPIILSGITSLSYVFTAGDLVYRCRVPECGDNGTEFEPVWLKYAVPMEQRSGKDVSSLCLRYQPANQTTSGNDSCSFSNTTMKCQDWVFETDESTIVSEFNVTCEDNQWKLALVGTMNSVGQFVGLPLVGYLSDRYGRKLALVGCLVSTSIIGLIRSFSPNYVTFVIMEFVNMIVSGSIIFGAAFVIGIELVGPEKRVLGSVIINGLDAIGEVLVGLLAWLLQNWQHLIWACYAPALLFISYYWLLPESVRWLMAQGRMNEAEAIIRNVAKTNGTKLSDQVLQSFQNGEKVEEQKDSEQSIGSVLRQVARSRILVLRLINCCFCWVTNTFVYFGLSLNSVAVGSNKFTSFILVCLIEIPGYTLTYFVLGSRLGRKVSLCLSLILSGLCCLAFIFVPKDVEWLQMVLYLAGKFSITIAFTTVYVYTAELFPTPLRHSLLGVCSMFGRVGSIVAPQTPLLERYMESLPLVLFGVMSIASGLLALLFPETRNARLPDTVEESENIGKNQEPKLSWSTSETNALPCDNFNAH